MMKITKPVVCQQCGKEMTTFSININNRTKRLLFTCPKGHTTELDETEYYMLTKNG